MPTASRLGENSIELLQNGGQYFPRLIADVDAASERVWLETYIFAEDQSGVAVADALIRAAKRGVETRLVIDGFGSHDHVGGLLTLMRDCGVRIKVFRPETGRFRFRKSRLRRLHRKLVVIDADICYCGGINVHDDRNMKGYQNPDSYGARFDFAVRMQGTIAMPITATMNALWQRLRERRRSGQSLWRRARGQLVDAGERIAQAIETVKDAPDTSTASAALAIWFVHRDNLRFRKSIENEYLRAIASAKSEVLIANAYFFPGRRLLDALNAAEARGVRVRLLLQGRKEYFLQHYASRAFYDALFNSGIEIAEYTASFLHAKVAVIDGQWATVGSSNLDPFSLMLAREANVFVRDAAFADDLKAALDAAWNNDSALLERQQWDRRAWFFKLKSRVAYGLARLLLLVVGLNPR